MKLLMFHVSEFWYKTYSKTLENVDTQEKEEKINEGIVVFIHIEKEDEERENKLRGKAIDNIRWLLKKTNTNTVVLHSFAHLSESKSSPEFAQKLIEGLKNSLEERHIITHVTPYGYFLEFKLHVLGESLAKVFKSF
ncbi:MAG: Threonyl-tRNA synthetase editing domain protein [Candidatus Roizmanbacteria bacterium GW2011_GWC2_37_13]|uniref:Threonyl-tRNA synthetase editing domain protein n=1 Tax=Candidatus Roizmanbacteria bacterium GW2011_GWC2_37_13 TaxID=1618486 RepID=A0A0G0FYU3_9BACT|nr:MAG: Threonyl-tRNA synthetase editing domain protein [Candidatus Roizmanbacteria bacterium GW2011_GWC2_37_13]